MASCLLDAKPLHASVFNYVNGMSKIRINIFFFFFRGGEGIEQGKSEGFESCDWPIVRKRPIWVKIGDVLYRVTLKFDGWPWKTIGHLSFTVSSFVQHFIAIHWGQPRAATVVKMAPTRPLASRSFCLLTPLCDHRSLSHLQQRSTEAWYTLYQNDKLVPFLIFVQ